MINCFLTYVEVWYSQCPVAEKSSVKLREEEKHALSIVLNFPHGSHLRSLISYIVRQTDLLFSVQYFHVIHDFADLCHTL